MSDTSNEIKLLKDLGLQSFQEAAQAYASAFNNAGLSEQWTKEQAEKYIAYLLRRQEDLVFVALINGQVVGGISAEIRRLMTEFLCITDLFVDPQFQGRGIASQLFKKLFLTTLKNYPDSKTVDTLADTTHPFPIQWYDKLGMHKTGWTHISGSIDEILTKLH